jgi:hypothetical protein
MQPICVCGKNFWQFRILAVIYFCLWIEGEEEERSLCGGCGALAMKPLGVYHDHCIAQSRRLHCIERGLDHS